jgi:hypothetical protein
LFKNGKLGEIWSVINQSRNAIRGSSVVQSLLLNSFNPLNTDSPGESEISVREPLKNLVDQNIGGDRIYEEDAIALTKNHFGL